VGRAVLPDHQLEQQPAAQRRSRCNGARCHVASGPITSAVHWQDAAASGKCRCTCPAHAFLHVVTLPPGVPIADSGSMQAQNERLRQEVERLQQQDAAGEDSAASAASQEALLAKVTSFTVSNQ